MILLKVKKVASVFLFLLFLGSSQPAIAQAPGVSSSNLDTVYGNIEPNVPRNLHTLSQGVIIETLSGFICTISGMDPLNPQGKCLGSNPKTGKLGYVTQQGGLGKMMGGLIGGTMSIPISSTDYLQYAASSFGITQKTYAADTTNGIGYDRLRPLLGVWTKFRDIAYLAFVLAFTIIGLAIMFRVKIDPRTVMTIQNQIPKLVIALILVTFSYAIAGFLIDLMYVILYFILIVFTSLTPTHVNVNASVFGVFNKAFSPSISSNFGKYPTPDVQLGYSLGNSGIMNLTLDVAKGISGALTTLTTDFIDSTTGSLFKILFTPFGVLDIGCQAFSFLASIPGKLPLIGGLFGGGPSCDFVDSFFQATISFVFGTVAFLVVLIAILYSLFRVWFTLIKSFAYVLVDAMIGPLWITAGIFPGSKLSFTTWVRHLMGHLSVFPMTFAVILLGKTIMDNVANGARAGDFFAPPLIGDAFSGNTHVAAFIGFGFILSIHSILDKTRKVIGAIDFGLVDIKQSFGKAGKIGSGGLQAATSRDIVYGKDTASGQYVPQAMSGWRKLGRGVGIIR